MERVINRYKYIENNLYITLVIYQEPSHDARSTKCKIFPYSYLPAVAISITDTERDAPTEVRIVYTDYQHQHINSRGEKQNPKLRDPNRTGFSFSPLIIYCPKTGFNCSIVQLYSHPISGDTSAIHMQTGMSPVIVSRDSIMRRDQ